MLDLSFADVYVTVLVRLGRSGIFALCDLASETLTSNLFFSLLLYLILFS